MTIILDQYTIPDRGVFQIQETVTINISATEAQRKANHWLFTQVSCMMGAGTPTLFIGERTVWRVPAILTAAHIGQVGVIGTIEVDADSGDMDATEAHKHTILQEASVLVDKLPPYQPRTTMPLQYLAKDREPTITQPEGNPRAIIAAARSRV